MKIFNFEVYTCNPETGEPGWDIKFPNVYADAYKEAVNVLKTKYPNFDCIILFNYGAEMKDGSEDMAAYANGANYRDTTYKERYR